MGKQARIVEGAFSSAEAALIAGVTEARIRDWRREGHEPVAEGGKGKHAVFRMDGIARLSIRSRLPWGMVHGTMGDALVLARLPLRYWIYRASGISLRDLPESDSVRLNYHGEKAESPARYIAAGFGEGGHSRALLELGRLTELESVKAREPLLWVIVDLREIAAMLVDLAPRPLVTLERE